MSDSDSSTHSFATERSFEVEDFSPPSLPSVTTIAVQSPSLNPTYSGCWETIVDLCRAGGCSSVTAGCSSVTAALWPQFCDPILRKRTLKICIVNESTGTTWTTFSEIRLRVRWPCLSYMRVAELRSQSCGHRTAASGSAEIPSSWETDATFIARVALTGSVGDESCLQNVIGHPLSQ